MDKCLICSSSDIVRYRYGNHLNKVNLRYVKYLMGSFASPFFRVISSKIKYKLLFSPLFWISKCNSCGYGHFERQISEEELENYYKFTFWLSEGLAPTDSEFLNDGRANGQYVFAQDELQRMSENSRLDILEIGAGPALASRMIQHKCPTATADVVEPGHGWSNYYREHSINKVADFFPFKNSKKYSYIHTSHWLEHVQDIHRVVESLRDMLLEDGIVFVEIPNCTEDYWTLDFVDTPHIHFFTEQSLACLFSKHHFQPIKSCAVGFSLYEEFEESKGVKLNLEVCNEAKISIRYSTHRQWGASLRMLFRKVA